MVKAQYEKAARETIMRYDDCGITFRKICLGASMDAFVEIMCKDDDISREEFEEILNMFLFAINGK